jgi:hypothetical protein
MWNHNRCYGHTENTYHTGNIRIYSYMISKENLQMNDTNTDTHNTVFKAVKETNNR